MQVTRTLSAPLFTEWSEQYVRLRVDDSLPATPLALAAPFARFVMQGHYPGMVSFRFLISHMKRLTMLCPCAWGDLRPVLQWMAEGKLVVRPWIAMTATVEEVPKLYRRVFQRDPSLMAALIRW